MKLSNKHMALIARLVLVVTIAASSGLTTVLHTCLMERMDCCGHSPGAGHCDCDLPGVLPFGPSVSGDSKCDTNTIVGGLTIKAGEVEPEQKHEFVRIAIAAMMPSLNSFPSRSGGLTHELFSLAVALSPPSVEKCVLNASLLI